MKKIVKEDVLGKHLKSFLDFSKEHLKLNSIPSVKLDDQKPSMTSFGSYSPGSESIVVNTYKRHPADVLRTLAHELKHHKQKEEGLLDNISVAGETGSTFENEANAEAGVIMRNYGKRNPDIYEERNKASFYDSLIKEALTDKQKSSVDKWPKGDHSWSNHAFPEGGERTHVPLEFPNHKSEHQSKVEDHLKSHGIHVHDYIGGFGTDKHGRQVAIGKALVKTKAEPHLVNGFANDPARQQLKAFKDYHVVVSKHPHDVAGMTSKGHSWANESCMNFSNGQLKGYLKADVEEGTHVAYLVHKDDHNIEKPLARIALKPHHNIDSDDTILRPEHRTYGNAPDAFSHTVNRWVNKHFPGKEDGIYKKDDRLYNDSGSGRNYTFGDKALKRAYEMDDRNMKEAVLSHPNVTGEILDLGMKSKYWFIRRQAVKSPNATKEHLDLGLKDKQSMVRGAVFLNPNADTEHIDRGMNDRAVYVRMHAVRHQNATKEHLHRALDSKNTDVRYSVFENPNADAEHIERGLKDSNVDLRMKVLEHPNITIDQLERASKNISSWVRAKAGVLLSARKG